MDHPSDELCQVVLTGPDLEWIRAFVRRLVDDMLAAAGHVDVMHSTYRWAGQVHEAEEARAILHTRREHVDAIAERVRAQHPYEVACVAATTIVDGGSDYVAWIATETARTSGDYAEYRV